MLLIILIACSVLLLILIHIYFHNGLKKVFNSDTSEANPIKISIVIAAKNEERNLEGLFASLDSLEYPQEEFEIIIVNDNSADRTYQKLDDYSSERPNVKVLTFTDKEAPPKKGALALGIAEAKYDFIMITDADCRPVKDWISAFVSSFRDGHDFVFGIAPFNQKNNSDINSLVCFENLRSTLLTLSAAGHGLPYSAAARSFGFKKDSFNRIGGYSQITNSIGGDDDLLLKEAVKSNMSIGVVTNPQALVYSDAPVSTSDYFFQKRRHTKTSHYYLKKNKIMLAVWHILNLFAAFSILLFPFSIFFPIPFILKVYIDIKTVRKYQSKLTYNFSDLETFLLQFIYEILIVFHFFNSFRKVGRWK